MSGYKRRSAADFSFCEAVERGIPARECQALTRLGRRGDAVGMEEELVVLDAPLCPSCRLHMDPVLGDFWCLTCGEGVHASGELRF